MRKLRVGSRGSSLALWQANFVLNQVRSACGVEGEVVVVRTSGDKFQQLDVGQLGLKGVFIKELEDALLEGRIDLAVHSMKDVPTSVPNGLTFPAVLAREDVRDCLIAREGCRLSGLPHGARVGTSSLRRRAQLLHHRPDLQLCGLRGNVDTRLRKLDQGEMDAVVLARAGLERLGMAGRISETLSTDVCLPAIGQGALGIEVRSEHRELADVLSRLNHEETHSSITAERALLARLEGGCQVPLGAWARCQGGRLVMDACVCSADGTECIRQSRCGDVEKPEGVGRELAEALLDAGAGRLLLQAGRVVGRA